MIKNGKYNLCTLNSKTSVSASDRADVGVLTPPLELPAPPLGVPGRLRCVTDDGNEDGNEDVRSSELKGGNNYFYIIISVYKASNLYIRQVNLLQQPNTKKGYKSRIFIRNIRFLY